MKVYKALQGVLAALVLFLLWTTPVQASSSIETVKWRFSAA
jgi:hypothetical protein